MLNLQPGYDSVRADHHRSGPSPTPIESRLFSFQDKWDYNSYTVHYFWWKKRFRIRQVVLDFLKKSKKTSLRLLDLGCGDGFDLFLIAAEIKRLKNNAAKNVKFVGIDINPENIDYLKKRVVYERCPDIFEVYHGDIQSGLEEFSDSSFDFILCSEVIEHLPEPEKAFSHISRLLVSGGQAIITTPNAGNAVSRLAGCFMRSKKQSQSSDVALGGAKTGCSGYEEHISAKNHHYWKTALHAAGLRVIKTYRGPLVYGYKWLDEKAILSGLLIFADGLIDMLFAFPSLAVNVIFLVDKRLETPVNQG
jgi:SAM-dependent methyltransferase